MKNRKKLKGAEAFGVRVIVDKSLDKYSKMNLFPEKLEEANKVVSKLRRKI
ncbi:MAG: hypothetical protein J0H07_11995 [Sphingobacteriales bacterium]|nr:hypothetical protein [Sphingobacteriales bacterium]